MRTKQGVVTAANMQGTVTVTVHRSVVHPLYQKRYRVSKKFLADTNGTQVGVGDLVEITECRPLSKRKRFKVTSILSTGPKVSEMVEEAALSGVMQSTTDEKSSMNSKKSKSSKSTDSSISSNSSTSLISSARP